MSSQIPVDVFKMTLVYKDSRVERPKLRTNKVPPSVDDPVQFKDVTILTGQAQLETDPARLYVPTSVISDPKKLPLLVYYHGGGFISGSPQDDNLHNYLYGLVSEANVVVVSADYRKAPDYHIETIYEDSWEAVKWAASHSGSEGPEEWLNTYADLTRVYIAGDSAGGNIAHKMTMMFGASKVAGIDRISGIVLFHPYFWGSEPVGNETTNSKIRELASELWDAVKPGSGDDDPDINPAMDPNLPKLGCSRVLVSTGSKDILRARAWYYGRLLGDNEWEGDSVEVMDFMREGHDFQLNNPTSDNVVPLTNRVAAFLNASN